MGTFHTITTEIIRSRSIANELEKNIVDWINKGNRLKYKRNIWLDEPDNYQCSFSMFYKNTSECFYEWYEIDNTGEHIVCASVSDERKTEKIEW